MSRKVRENIIAAQGDYPVYPAGQPVYADHETINVLPGQLVFFDPITNVSVAATTTAVHDRLVIGVGVDTTGDGATNSIRRCFGDKLYGNYISSVTAEPARSGTAEIKDLLFSAVEDDTHYSINVTVEDDRTQNQNDYKRKAIYTFGTQTKMVGATCDDIACGLVDAVNNDSGIANPGKTSVFNKLAQKKPDLPFYAVRLFTNSITYCLPSVSGPCDTCLNIAGITGMFANGVATVFPNTVNPNDPTLTLKAQIARVVRLINETLDGNGSAVITGGVGSCIELQLEVNTCFADFQLHDDAGADIAPCLTTNPFDPITLAKACKNCGAGTSTITHTCGIRIIAKQVKIECGIGGMPPNPPKGYFGREIDIFTGSGFARGASYKRDVQKMTLPENFGYLWQWRDYASDNGGRGRGHDQFASGNYGPMNLPLGRSRSAAANKVRCQESYCSYILEHGLPNSDMHTHGNLNVARGRTVILIPTGDATTIAAFEAVFNAYVTSSPFHVKGAVTCAVDSDQDAGTAGDVQGFIV